MKNINSITVSVIVNKSAGKVWELWTQPCHIIHWYHASDDWHVPRAVQNLHTGNTFLIRMEAKDGSFGFDFEGVYDQIINQKFIGYTLGDGRKVTITFESTDAGTVITETFDAENENPVEMQRTGWQNILNNFKKYAEITP
jgi:uncharacterized protein YndB with AHSA1/START domain